jgi:hypothetical protein
MNKKLFTLMAGFGFAVTMAFTQTAPVQIIHNATNADSVDIYVDGTLAVPDFKYRTSTPYVDLSAAGVAISVEVAPGNSSSAADAIYSTSLTLNPANRYIVMAAGEVGGAGAAAFDLYVFDAARNAAGTSGNTDVLAFHGATDAGTVGVYENALGVVADPFDFADFAGYVELPTADYYLKVTATGGSPSLLGYDAPLATLGLDDAAITVVASGYLAPTAGQPEFGLFAVTADGGEFLPLPASIARVQVIHNAADAAAAMVDVYLNDGMLIDDFEFRTASEFIDAPAGSDFDIVIQPSNSMDTTNALWRKSYQLMSGETYILVANGIVSTSGYDPVKAFDIYVMAMGREAASTSGNTDLLVFHGSTDAPVVDIYEGTAGELIDNLAYVEFDDDYLELPTADYEIQVRDEIGSTIVARYQAPLATLGLNDAAIVAVASGFLTPGNNSDGPAFGIWVALATGGDLVELPTSTVSTNDISFENRMNVKVYPNPVSSYMNIDFTLEVASDVELEIISITGTSMFRSDLGSRTAGANTETLNISSLENGIYMLRMRAGADVHIARIRVVK